MPVIENTTLVELKEKKTTAETRLAALICKLREGALVGFEFDEMKSLHDKVAVLDAEITEAETTARQEQQRKEQIARQEARAKFDEVIARGEVARATFLAAYRTACISLGDLCLAQTEGCALLSKLASPFFGSPVECGNALRELDLNDAPARALGGLHGFVDSNWKTSYEVRPLKGTSD
jgi:multidrug efflux pump subunit AcrA (membrane-fusion protein)